MKVKCIYCENEFDITENRFDESYPVCIPCDDKNKSDMDKAMQEFIEIENEIHKKDQRLLNAIKSVKGDSYYDALCDLMQETECTSEFSIVDKPKGDYQKEYWHNEIQGVWVDQWCNGGYVGDDFQGDIYVKIKRKNKRDKCIKLPYPM